MTWQNKSYAKSTLRQYGNFCKKTNPDQGKWITDDLLENTPQDKFDRVTDTTIQISRLEIDSFRREFGDNDDTLKFLTWYVETKCDHFSMKPVVGIIKRILERGGNVEEIHTYGGADASIGLREEMASVKAENQKLKAQLTSSRVDIDRVRRENDTLKANAVEIQVKLDTAVGATTRENRAFRVLSDEISNERKEKAVLLGKFETDNTQMHADLVKTCSENKHLKGVVNCSEMKVGALEIEKLHLQTEIEDLRRQIDVLTVAQKKFTVCKDPPPPIVNEPRVEGGAAKGPSNDPKKRTPDNEEWSESKKPKTETSEGIPAVKPETNHVPRRVPPNPKTNVMRNLKMVVAESAYAVNTFTNYISGVVGLGHLLPVNTQPQEKADESDEEKVSGVKRTPADNDLNKGNQKFRRGSPNP